jgi:hypothetical protein
VLQHDLVLLFPLLSEQTHEFSLISHYAGWSGWILPGTPLSPEKVLKSSKQVG